MPPKLLSEEEIIKRLAEVAPWTRDGKQIQRKIKFKSFLESIGFVNKVAILAEVMDHHPDILIQWNRVSLTVTTHSAGGLTDMDFVLAKRVENALAKAAEGETK